MPNLLLLNIGTGHGSKEQDLIHSKLRASSRYADIGVIGNHMRGGFGDTGAHGRKKDNITMQVPKNNGWVLTNEGQSGLATGMLDQTKANVKLIKDLNKNHGGVEEIFMLAHSRGCILSLRIAAFIYEEIPKAKVYLFLIDPVKRMSRGTDFYNRQVHANVQNIQIIAMEDQEETVFKLMTVRRKTGKNVKEVDASRYIRMPGAHGTATQITGNPIGSVTLKLALRFLTNLGAPFDTSVQTDDQSVNSSYMNINIINPINRQTGDRKVNDGKLFKQIKAGVRDLSGLKDNDWHGTGFFINNHHFDIWNKKFDGLFVQSMVAALTNNQLPNISDNKRRLRDEYGRWIVWDPKGRQALEKKKDVYARLKAQCGIQLRGFNKR